MEVNKTFERQLKQAEPEGLTLKALRSKVVRNWYLFVIFCAIGLAAAFTYKKITPSYYRISTMILIKSNDKAQDLNNVFSQLNENSTSAAIQDQE